MTTYLKLFFSPSHLRFFCTFALAEEGATTTQEIATTTVEIAQPTIVETVATTSAVGADATTTPATSESAITTSDTNSQEEPTAETATSTEVRLPLPSNESQTSVEQQNQPEPTMVERIVEVIREVPVYVQERAFDPATAPGTVSLSVRCPMVRRQPFPSLPLLSVSAAKHSAVLGQGRRYHGDHAARPLLYGVSRRRHPLRPAQRPSLVLFRRK